MKDLSPTEKLLRTSERWSASGHVVGGESRSFAPASDPVTPVEDQAFRQRLVASIPILRSFARGLCGDATVGDDLAQDALLKAWQYRAQFTPGTNFKGWILKIARNHFYSQRRRVWREAPLDEAVGAQVRATGADQFQALMLNDLRNALNALSDEQREAAILVGAGGFSHRQAAEMCAVPEGTMKSRVCRARAKLALLLENGDLTYDAAPASLAAGLIMAELSALSDARG
uniref:RNA polymerase, sigma-24 subunit, ECF subfamily n=1 Tax=Caulobacter sp. (strain K31) TaxID=366602 RepID=B0SY63_CAUSK